MGGIWITDEAIQKEVSAIETITKNARLEMRPIKNHEDYRTKNQIKQLTKKLEDIHKITGEMKHVMDKLKL